MTPGMIGLAIGVAIGAATGFVVGFNIAADIFSKEHPEDLENETKKHSGDELRRPRI